MNYANWIIPIILMILLGGFYIGIHLRTLVNPKYSKIFWILLYLIITSMLLLRNIIIAFFFYLIFFFLIFDILKGIAKIGKKEEIFNKINQNSKTVILLSALLTLYGFLNANIITIKNYDIHLNNLSKNLTIAVITDVHLKNEKQLKDLQKRIENEPIDWAFFVGDIFDEYTSDTLKEKAYETFSQLKVQKMFWVEGNHDFLTPESKEKLTERNIQVLEDESITIDAFVNIIGRKDYRHNLLNEPRKNLTELIEETNPTLPTILLDHQPREEENIENLPIDLQISGHTHAGQIFPGNFILESGYKKKGNYQKIVSTGMGVWAVPIRTAKHNELVILHLT